MVRNSRYGVVARCLSSLCQFTTTMMTIGDIEAILGRSEWPGNVRELQNVVERAAVMAKGDRISLDDLPDDVRRATPGTGAPGVGTVQARSLADVERAHIVSVLDSVGGNRAKAALVLGIGSATLFRKLKGYRGSKNT